MTKITAVQRDLLHGARVHYRIKRAFAGFKGSSDRLYFHRRRLTRNAQGDRQARNPTDRNFDIFDFLCLEALPAHGQRVHAGRKIREVKVTVCRRGHLTRQSRAGVLDFYRGIGNGCAGCICDASGYAASKCLPENADGAQRGQSQYEKQPKSGSRRSHNKSPVWFPGFP